jgi:hypothetical protein
VQVRDGPLRGRAPVDGSWDAKSSPGNQYNLQIAPFLQGGTAAFNTPRATKFGAYPKPSGPGQGVEAYTNYWAQYSTYAAVTRGIVPMWWDTADTVTPAAWRRKPVTTAGRSNSENAILTS